MEKHFTTLETDFTLETLLPWRKGTLHNLYLSSWIFDRDMLRNRGPTSDSVSLGGYLLLVIDLAARWRSAVAVKLRLNSPKLFCTI